MVISRFNSVFKKDLFWELLNFAICHSTLHYYTKYLVFSKHLVSDRCENVFKSNPFKWSYTLNMWTYLVTVNTKHNVHAFSFSTQLRWFLKNFLTSMKNGQTQKSMNDQMLNWPNRKHLYLVRSIKLQTRWKRETAQVHFWSEIVLYGRLIVLVVIFSTYKCNKISFYL